MGGQFGELSSSTSTAFRRDPVGGLNVFYARLGKMLGWEPRYAYRISAKI